MSLVPTEFYMDPYHRSNSSAHLPSPPQTDRTYMTPAESEQQLADVYFDWPWPVDSANAPIDVKDEQRNNFENLVASLDLLNASHVGDDDDLGQPAVVDSKNKMLKRKRQNRAAQRAFRDRKEKAMRDLAENVAANRNKVSELEQENKRLTELLQEAHIEIKTLRSVSAPVRVVSSEHTMVDTNFAVTESNTEDPSEIVLRIDLRSLMKARPNLQSNLSQSSGDNT